jgi:uncharacterized protein (TIGR03643 family)
MSKKRAPKLPSCLLSGDTSAIIRMAWDDRTTFETIKEQSGFSESEVIKIMRKQLKSGSYRIWRMRVRARVTKHRSLRSSKMNFFDESISKYRHSNFQIG